MARNEPEGIPGHRPLGVHGGRCPWWGPPVLLGILGLFEGPRIVKWKALPSWPDGSRLIKRKERSHPGAQLTFTDIDGMRVTALLTNTPAGSVPFQAAGLELRHRGCGSRGACAC